MSGTIDENLAYCGPVTPYNDIEMDWHFKLLTKCAPYHSFERDFPKDTQDINSQIQFGNDTINISATSPRHPLVIQVLDPKPVVLYGLKGFGRNPLNDCDMPEDSQLHLPNEIGHQLRWLQLILGLHVYNQKAQLLLVNNSSVLRRRNLFDSVGKYYWRVSCYKEM